MKKQFFLLVMSVCGVLFVATTQNARAGFLPKEQKSWVIDDDSGTSVVMQSTQIETGLVSDDSGFTSTQISPTGVKNVAINQTFKENPNVVTSESGRLKENTAMLNSAVSISFCESIPIQKAVVVRKLSEQMPGSEVTSFLNSFSFADMNKKLGAYC